MSDSLTPPPQRADQQSTAGTQPERDEELPRITPQQARRINAPIQGMLISMAVLLMLVLLFLWLNPQPNAEPYRADVDVAEEAGFIADQADFTPAAPELADGWTANYARWEANSRDGVPLWSVGLLSPDSRLIDVAQTADSNPTWLAQRTELIPETDQRDVSGVSWSIHHRDPGGQQEEFTAWVGELQDSTVILSGQASESEFEYVAEQLSDQSD